LIFNNSIFLPFFLILLFGPGRSHPSVPTRGLSWPPRAGSVKGGRRQVVHPSESFSRPSLDRPEYGGKARARRVQPAILALLRWAPSATIDNAQDTQRSPPLVASLPHPSMGTSMSSTKFATNTSFFWALSSVMS